MSGRPSVADVHRLVRAHWTQDAIARELGTTRHQVRRIIEAQGLARALPPEPEYAVPRTYAEPSAPRRFSWQEDRA